ncbi:TPA: LysR family transcriptional regulator [Burkholderia vietnamiensis]|nr:hypothetical protein WJ01_10980 [Burkholderia vietnamiensis]MBR7976194.1 LysR family transcriptional regulator [Burkholderia vietnamiensis]HDR9203579.1 LysR family transcriptional regulator [Burkholderia vietnamiensis]HDR9359204.1 LysR family transcriptional regulator [Burkholderia vietnamiensis]
MLVWVIRYFLAVPEHRYFTCAAEALHVSQLPRSEQIRQLEATRRTKRIAEWIQHRCACR